MVKLTQYIGMKVKIDYADDNCFRKKFILATKLIKILLLGSKPVS